MEVNVLPIASIGLTELAILAGVTGLACGLPLIGALAFVWIMLNQRRLEK